ncbi:hypothetical protein [Amphritea sp.]|uniref:hypothetical protein n=1 Tax=Amphritea sp. TaxID=1872502 RepID=UPI003D11C5A1
MFDYKKSVFLSVSCLALFSSIPAEAGTSLNSIGIGHASHTSDTLDSSKNKFDYSFVKWTNVNINDWGNVTQFLEFDNPFKTDKNQQGIDGVTTLKHWARLNYNISDTKFHLWLQNYYNANEVIVEDNFYYGVGVHGGNPKSGLWQVNAGLHHVMGKNPWGQSLNGYAGGAFSAQYFKPFVYKNQKLQFIAYTEAFLPNDRYKEQSFAGSALTWDGLEKDSIGYLATATLNWRMSQNISTSLTYKNQSDYGGYSADTNHIFMYGINFHF